MVPTVQDFPLRVYFAMMDSDEQLWKMELCGVNGKIEEVVRSLVKSNYEIVEEGGDFQRKKVAVVEKYGILGTDLILLLNLTLQLEEKLKVSKDLKECIVSTPSFGMNTTRQTDLKKKDGYYNSFTALLFAVSAGIGGLNLYFSPVSLVAGSVPRIMGRMVTQTFGGNTNFTSVAYFPVFALAGEFFVLNRQSKWDEMAVSFVSIVAAHIGVTTVFGAIATSIMAPSVAAAAAPVATFVTTAALMKYVVQYSQESVRYIKRMWEPLTK